MKLNEESSDQESRGPPPGELGRVKNLSLTLLQSSLMFVLQVLVARQGVNDASTGHLTETFSNIYAFFLVFFCGWVGLWGGSTLPC